MACFILVCIASLCYYYKIAKKRCDLPNFINLFRYFQNLIDFWTDCIFVIILHLKMIDDDDNENNNSQQQEICYYLFHFAVTFVALPYLLSCYYALNWIIRWNRWKQDNPVRLKKIFTKI